MYAKKKRKLRQVLLLATGSAHDVLLVVTATFCSESGKPCLDFQEITIQKYDLSTIAEVGDASLSKLLKMNAVYQASKNVIDCVHLAVARGFTYPF